MIPATAGSSSLGTRGGKSSRSPGSRGIPAATSPGIFSPANSISSTLIRGLTALVASRHDFRAAAVVWPLRGLQQMPRILIGALSGLAARPADVVSGAGPRQPPQFHWRPKRLCGASWGMTWMVGRMAWHGRILGTGGVVSTDYRCPHRDLQAKRPGTSALPVLGATVGWAETRRVGRAT